MSTWFSRLFSSTPVDDGYSQPQREALLDLLVFCMVADRRIEFSEQDFLKDQTSSFSWSSATTVEEFVKQSRKRADQAHLADATRAAYAADINGRLQTNELRTEAISLTRRMFVVDSDYAKVEKSAYSVIAHAFGWAT
jgi:hypothetical protein